MKTWTTITIAVVFSALDPTRGTTLYRHQVRSNEATKSAVDAGSTSLSHFSIINFPKPDLEPLTFRFADPSLRNYPDANVPSAAVESIRVRRNIDRVKGLDLVWSSGRKTESAKVKPQRPDSKAEERKSDFDPAHEPTSLLGLILETDTSDVISASPKRLTKRQQQGHFSGLNPADVFEAESLIPLPISNPAFALPLIHEDPHFDPNYDRVKFQPPRT